MMSKPNVAWILMSAACAATMFTLLLSGTDFVSFIMLVAAGALSPAALMAALIKPRQTVLASFAALLTAAHAGLWFWIALIHVTGL